VIRYSNTVLVTLLLARVLHDVIILKNNKIRGRVSIGLRATQLNVIKYD
jgi:hypothetical protein